MLATAGWGSGERSGRANGRKRGEEIVVNEHDGAGGGGEGGIDGRIVAI